MKKGRCGTMIHDYKRNGTATLFAAVDTLNGQVISMCEARQPHQEVAEVPPRNRSRYPGSGTAPHDRGQLLHPQTR